MRTLRIGIVGCGKVAHERHLPALRALSRARVVAAADLDRARVDRFRDAVGADRGYDDYRALIDDDGIDAIGVLTPTSSHAEIGEAVLASGRHLLLEKPLAMDLDECDRLVAAAAAARGRAGACQDAVSASQDAVTASQESAPGSQHAAAACVGFNLRWHRLVRRARQFIATGALGRIKGLRSVYAHNRTGEDAPDWHRKLALGGGVVFNEAVHHFDLWRCLTGLEIEEVSGISHGSDCWEDETHVTTARLTDDAIATGLWTFRSVPDSQVEVYGEEGRLLISCYQFDGLRFLPRDTYPGDPFDRIKHGFAALREIPRYLPAARRGGDFAATFFGLWEHFRDCALDGVRPEAPLEEGRHAIAAALASIESAATGRAVRVAPSPVAT